MSASGKKTLEFTLRGVILGVLITLVFTAANVYLGLKVGLTFATSIPAAVISMAVLSAFKNSTILENNIVQTVASAAGTLSAIIFVLPGLVIVGWWTGFPFWTSFWVCASGGVLGVLFTIPLRRAMVTTSDLPYPEGVAAAEVLEVGEAARTQASAESREGLLAVIYSAIAAAVLQIVAATRFAAGGYQKYFMLTAGGSSFFDMGYSLALVGAGYLVGLSVGMAMLLGLLISWAGFVPYLTSLHPMTGTIDAYTDHIWRHDVRFIGAGAIAVASVWTLLKLIGPVVRGVVATMSANRARVAGTADLRDTDLSPSWIGALAVACLVVIAWLLFQFLAPTPLSASSTTLVVAAVPFVFIGGQYDEFEHITERVEGTGGDHVHLSVKAHPKHSPSYVANQFKGYTSRPAGRVPAPAVPAADPVVEVVLRRHRGRSVRRDGAAVHRHPVRAALAQGARPVRRAYKFRIYPTAGRRPVRPSACGPPASCTTPPLRSGARRGGCGRSVTYGKQSAQLKEIRGLTRTRDGGRSPPSSPPCAAWTRCWPRSTAAARRGEARRLSAVQGAGPVGSGRSSPVTGRDGSLPPGMGAGDLPGGRSREDPPAPPGAGTVKTFTSSGKAAAGT